MMKWDEYYKKKGFFEWLNALYFSRLFTREISKNTKPRDRMLEAGCGSGMLSVMLAQRGHDVELLDLSRQAIRVSHTNFARHKVKRPKTHIANIFNMPFKGKEFDVVFNQGVIEHFDEPSRAIKEMLRVGKKVIVLVPAHNSPMHLIYLFFRFIKKPGWWFFEDQAFFQKRQLEKAMKLAGCKNIHVHKIRLSFGMTLIGVGDNGRQKR